MASTQTPFSCGNYHSCPATLFFCCYWSADRWCSNRCLDSMYVSLVTSYEPTKLPARVCCEIFTNVRWKQIKVTKKLFFWSDEIWDFNLVHHKSIFVLTPLTKSLSRQQRWFIYLLLTFQSQLWSTRNTKWIIRVACSRSGQIPELLVDIPMSRMPKLKLPVWWQPQRYRPSFPKHRVSNHPNLQLQAWRLSQYKLWEP